MTQKPVAPPHHFTIRIAFADTDAGGVVYHARYLEIAERARMAMLHDYDLSGFATAAEGVIMVVRHLTIDYVSPARLDEIVTVATRVTNWGGASFELEQRITVEARNCAVLAVRLVTVDKTMRPIRMPERLRLLGGDSHGLLQHPHV